MHPILAIGVAIIVIVYLVLQCLLYVTQSTREPRLTENDFPFVDPVLGMAKHQARYLASLGFVDTAFSEETMLTQP